jgi:hypothetical protein
MRPQILWIEDQVNTDLMDLAAQVYAACKYDLVIALDVSEGLRQISRTKFDIVIVDIRLEPGADAQWIQFYKMREYDKLAARLGLQLLHCLLKPDAVASEIRVSVPEWVHNGHTRFGVLTVESPREVKADLAALGITVYRQKTERTSSTVLVEMIEELLRHSHGTSAGGSHVPAA